MKLTAAPRILLVAAVCASALVGFVAAEGMARASGQEVALPIQGVDPRDFLRGHYVRLAFNAPLPEGQSCPIRRDDQDWLALRPMNGAFVLVGGATSREEAEQVGPIPVKGTFDCLSPTVAPESGQQIAPAQAQIDIGIDRFYVDQKSAERIEAVLREHSPDSPDRAFAIVSVGRDGRARLKALLIDDHRLDLGWS